MKMEILNKETNSTILTGNYKLENGVLICLDDKNKVKKMPLVDLPKNIVVNISGSKNFVHYVRTKDTIQIGCVVLKAADWMDRWEIGQKFSYTQEQSEEYDEYIKCINAISIIKI